MNPMEWIDARYEVPAHEEMVLAVVTGQFGGIRLESAYEFARYVFAEGWILNT